MKKIFTIGITAGLLSCGSGKNEALIVNGPTVAKQETPPPAVRPAPVKNAETAKIQVYNDVAALIAALSKNGIGKFGTPAPGGADGDFKFDTEKYQFGKSAAKNDIYYVVSGKNGVAQTVTLTMNINAKSDRRSAMELFRKTMDKTFKSVNVDLPLPVSEALGYGKSKSAETKSASVALRVNKGTTEIVTLSITSK